MNTPSSAVPSMSVRMRARRSWHGHFFAYDPKCVKNWSVALVIKRIILIGSLSLLSIIAVPVYTHGQTDKQTVDDIEIRNLRERAAAVEASVSTIAPKVAVLVVQMDDVRDDIKWLLRGVFGLIVSGIMVVFTRVMGLFGLTLRDEVKR